MKSMPLRKGTLKASITMLSCLRMTLWIMKITNAPTATPQMLPMPPSTTIASTVNETSNRKRFGLTSVSLEAEKTPASPAVDAPMANASNFVVTVLTPFAAAASSSSRMAFHARPSRESCNR
jgi:hypothetical protein